MELNSLNHGEASVSETSSVNNIFNDFFVNVGMKLAESQPTIDFIFDGSVNNDKSIFFNGTNEMEIKMVINELRNKRSAGSDDISNFLIKLTQKPLTPFFTTFINRSITQSSFQDILKIAVVRHYTKREVR